MPVWEPVLRLRSCRYFLQRQTTLKCNSLNCYDIVLVAQFVRMTTTSSGGGSLMKRMQLTLGLLGFMAANLVSAATIFTDRSAFQAAIGPFSVETFESASLVGACTGGGVASQAFSGFSASTAPTATKVLASGCDGANNTTPAGFRYLLSDTDIAGVGSSTLFTLDNAMLAFGFDYTDFEVGPFTATVNGTGYGITGVGGFWGILDTTAFSTVTVLGSDSSVGFDDVTLQVTAVPEPTSLALLGAVLGAFGLSRRRNKRMSAG